MSFLFKILLIILLNQSINGKKFGIKKRLESLCPVEYEACFCEYTNTNSIEDTSSSISTFSLSIMIDCQSYTSENENNASKLNKTKTLTEIPKISLSNLGSRLKHLNLITHLDLSRTEITEIPTDSFQGLAGLETIVISNCKNLVKIKMFAFRNLPNLKTLVISNNPKLIELEPHSFGSLKNINYLSLVMNNLSVIDGYIFSTSTSIRRIDFIGNPIKKIKSHAFHGLRNVSELLLSLDQKRSPIESIEGDSFISTAFVDEIYLEGIPAKKLHTNSFRGLSFCKSLHLSKSLIEEIEPNAFYRANNIKNISLVSSNIKNISLDSFKGVFNIEIIDLRDNYLNSLDQLKFEKLIISNFNNKYKAESLISNDSIRLFDMNENVNNFMAKRLLFDKNPIPCDCNLYWVLNNLDYKSVISLPEMCAGPKGFDCLRIADLNLKDINCKNDSILPSQNRPCDELVYDKSEDVNSVSVPKGKNKYNEEEIEENEVGKGDEEGEEEEENIEDDQDIEEQNKNNDYSDYNNLNDASTLNYISDIKTTFFVQQEVTSTTEPESIKAKPTTHTTISKTRKTSTLLNTTLINKINNDIETNIELINNSLGLSNSANCFIYSFRFFNFLLILIYIY